MKREWKYRPSPKEWAERDRNKQITAQLAGKVPREEAAKASAKRKALDYYYKTCPFPKPQSPPKEKKVNGWKDKQRRRCYYCGTSGAERHEVYPGTGKRQICIDNGFQVDLCTKCHIEMHRNLTPAAQAKNDYWKTYYQREYEDKLINTGITPEQARELWIKLIGRSYI